ncbi:hypothetical protein RRF57_010672 [Xylaria bambusicola]|uniref:Uncharacterized protein n=1 Tax=Xylaria bambusicola TaxID=326684 RepID=A0AAN7UVC0_9PEZI
MGVMEQSGLVPATVMDDAPGSIDDILALLFLCISPLGRIIRLLVAVCRAQRVGGRNINREDEEEERTNTTAHQRQWIDACLRRSTEYNPRAVRFSKQMAGN